MDFSKLNIKNLIDIDGTLYTDKPNLLQNLMNFQEELEKAIIKHKKKTEKLYNDYIRDKISLEKAKNKYEKTEFKLLDELFLKHDNITEKLLYDFWQEMEDSKFVFKVVRKGSETKKDRDEREKWILCQYHLAFLLYNNLKYIECKKEDFVFSAHKYWHNNFKGDNPLKHIMKDLASE